ncbi:Outer membrane protein A precursor (plasmid) [Collimonas arenae]|uniref:Outer membrane protein A n=1 Tax=Collimonas arenae TaxID=279058 RepID=A0A0A1FKD4_9BURK|nr:OmpA family protein [Collimonas arenae]AIY44185.1 Outer membrane protein A precursor [Collimonas arenae]
MLKNTILALAALCTGSAFASVATEADALMPAAKKIPDSFQRGLAEGFLEIAARQDREVLVSSTFNDVAPKALQNGRHFVDGSAPFIPLYTVKNWPSRPNWAKAIREIEVTNIHASASSCKSESAGRLAVLTDEIWKEQEETHGTRWVHGWAQIERAKKLRLDVERDMADCVAPTPPPSLPVVAPKAKPIVLSASTTFKFDSAALTQEGKQIVNILAQRINTAPPEKIAVTGFTDRLGSVQHNATLSKARAQTIADELKNDGVTSTFTVQGAGSSSPLIACPGKESPSVIACLAPNRRVEILSLPPGETR